MNDNEKPNEDDEVDEAPVFYYSREHRLSRAPAVVRALNDENYARPSLGRRLFGTKENAIILVSILIICAMFTVVSRLSTRGTSVKLGANTLDLNIIREGDVLGLRILKTVPKSGEFYIGAVNIAVTPVIAQLREGETPQVFAHRVFFNPADSESFFISLPFDGENFYVLLNTDDEQKIARVK